MLHSLFDPDNGFSSVVGKIIDMVVLSLVFAFCCLPIVTAGPACSALYYGVVKSVRRQRSYCVREFFREFRASLKKGILVHLILMGLAAVFFSADMPLMLSFFEKGTVDNIFFGLLFLCKLLVLLGLCCWLYPLLSRYEQGVLSCFQWALHLLLKHFPRTLLCILLALASAFLFWLEPLLICILPSATALLVSFLTEPVLRAICREEDAAGSEKDSWYLER